MKRSIKKHNGVARVPLITQLEYRECGAACLSMIAAYYGKWVPLEQTRSDCGVARHGVSAGNIVRAARSYGFEARGYSLTADALAKRVTFPCIIHWEMKHFVVLCGFRGGYAYINSPSRGRQRIPLAEFEDSFTGVVLDITPGEDFVPSGNEKSIVSFAKKRLSGMAGIMALFVIFMVINSLFGFIEPGMTRSFLDRILTGRDMPYLNTFIMIMAFLALSQFIVTLSISISRLRVERDLAHSGNSSYIRKLLYVPQGFYFQRLAGDLLMRKGTNASISLSLVNTIAPLFIHFTMMVFYLFVMIYYSPVLTLVGLLSVFLNLFMSRIIAKRRVDYDRMYLNDSSVYSSTAITGLEMMESIRASGAEGGFFQSFLEFGDKKYDGRLLYLKADARLSAFPAFISRISNHAVMIIGVYLAMQGRLTLGLLMAFMGYLAAFMNPADTLIASGQKLSEMRTDMERVEDVMEYPDDPIAVSDSKENVVLSGRIDVRSLTFSYSRFDDPVIEDFNMSITPGSLTVITGESGCGKTTLISLLTGLYVPGGGEILYDGMGIETIGHRAFTQNVAVVDQDIRLFSDTVRNNLTLWDTKISMEDMVSACKDADIYEAVIKRGGFDVMFYPEEYSGGQRQRLEIARALCKKPRILILDEATANLDAGTEERILSAIRARGITVIMVTHRDIPGYDRLIELSS